MGLYFSISSLIMIIILTVIFYIKKSVKNEETSIYKRILLTTIVGLSLETITGIWYLTSKDSTNIFYNIACKLTSSYFLIWCYNFTSYLMCICNIDKKKWNILTVLVIITFLTILVLPLEFTVMEDGIIIPRGNSILLCYLGCGIGTIINIFIRKKSRKKTISKESRLRSHNCFNNNYV